MFPSFETAIRKRSGEECKVVGSEERYGRNQRRPASSACRRVTSPATRNYTGRMQNQGRYKGE